MRHLTITSSITSRDSLSVDKYLAEIAKENLITIEEEVKLAGLIREGSQAALDKLVKANLRFVVSVAKQYQNKGMTLTDLINEGNMGLIKAAKRFDETRGFKFISYAVWWIRQSIMQAIAENSRIIRLPLNRHAGLRKIRTATADLEQRLERAPTAEELSSVMGISVNDVEDSWMFSAGTLSFDAPMPSSEEGAFSDIISDGDSVTDDHLIKESLNTDITRILSMLSPREAEVLKRYYGLGTGTNQTLDEIGIYLSLTRERVRQVKETALRRLRGRLSKKMLQSYLG
jgi:RNA polymerase primary sigma factor